MAWDILEQLSHAERFDMVLLFMSSKEKKGENVRQSLSVSNSTFLTNQPTYPPTDRPADRQTDRLTDERTDGWTDCGLTDCLSV